MAELRKLVFGESEIFGSFFQKRACKLRIFCTS